MMPTLNKLLGLADNVRTWLLIDRYQMGRMKLDEYFIRDQFSEETHVFGHSNVYYWQHSRDDSCIVKVDATTTDSNKIARQAMERFISRVANPKAYLVITNDNEESEEQTETADSSGIGREETNLFMSNAADPDKLLVLSRDNAGFNETEENNIAALLLIWGNIFLHIESIGERDHSINSFLENLRGHWAKGMDSVEDQNPDFELSASKTELKVGEEAVLFRTGPDDDQEYHTFIYIAGPRDPVRLYKEEGVIKLKIESMPKRALASPVVLLMGLRSDGKFVKSKRLKLKIIEG